MRASSSSSSSSSLLLLLLVVVVVSFWFGFVVVVYHHDVATTRYRRVSSNVVDTAFIAALMALNFAGLMFEAGINTPELIAAIVLLVLAGTIGTSLALCVRETVLTQRSRAGQRRLRLPVNVQHTFAAQIHEAFASLDPDSLNAVVREVADIAGEKSSSGGGGDSSLSRVASTLPTVLRSNSLRASILEMKPSAQRLITRSLSMTEVHAVLEIILRTAWHKGGKSATSSISKYTVGGAFMHARASLRGFNSFRRPRHVRAFATVVTALFEPLSVRAGVVAHTKRRT